MRVLAVLACALLAGCAATAPGSEVAAPAEVTSILLRTCYGLEAFVPVDAAAVARTLPEGFAPVPYPGDPLGASAILIVGVHDCETAALDPGSTVPGGLAFVATAVVPPEEERDAAVDAAVLAFGFGTASPEVADVLAGWGLRTERATLALERPTPGSTTMRASGQWGGFSAEIAGAARMEPEEGAVIRFYGPDGVAAFDVHVAPHAAGTGAGSASVRGAPVDAGPGMAVLRQGDGLYTTLRPVGATA